MTQNDIRPDLGLRPIINVSGTMTVARRVHRRRRRRCDAWPRFCRNSSRSTIFRRRRAGRSRACAAPRRASSRPPAPPAITLAVAGAMTGCDLGRDRAAARYGRPQERSADHDRPHGRLRRAGRAGDPRSRARRSCRSDRRHRRARYQLDGAIDERTAAAVYVVSHHTVQYGQIPLEEFVADLPCARRAGHRRRGVGIRPEGLPRRRRRLSRSTAPTSSSAARPAASSRAARSSSAPPSCRTWASAAA